MSVHLQRQIDRLKKMILSLGGLVEEAVEASTRAIETRDIDLAEQVIANDRQVDLMEIDVEEECLHTLALHQPVAFDLRYVVSVLKMNSDLERIGDLAVNIAEQARFLTHLPPMPEVPYELPRMWVRVRAMLKDSLDAMVQIDVGLAEKVVDADDEVDAIHRGVYKKAAEAIRGSGDPDAAERSIHLMTVSRNLERIADHAVNIAQDVMYMAKGDILRHSHRREELENGGG